MDDKIETYEQAVSHDVEHIDPAKIRPWGNRILVRRQPTEEIRNGLVIPDKYAGQEQYGRVLAVGQGIKQRRDKFGRIHRVDEPITTVKVGDLVGFEGDQAMEFRHDTDLLILHFEDVLFVVEAEGDGTSTETGE